MMSMTSARPLGRGRSRYPRDVGAPTASMSPSPQPRLRFARLLAWQRLLRAAHELLADVGAVLRQRLGDVRLADAVQVADRPVELLEGVLRRFAVAIGLLLLGVVRVFLVVLCHQFLRTGYLLPAPDLRLDRRSSSELFRGGEGGRAAGRMRRPRRPLPPARTGG